MNIKLSIVILNYNTKELIIDCLTSIKNSQGIDFGIKVIAVDNASSDGSVEALKNIPWITLIESNENNGFSRGNNLAIKEIEGDYAWFLNPDTVVEPNTISHMVSYMDRNPDVGISTPKLVLTNGKFDKNCHRGIPSPWNSLCHFTGLSKLFPRSKLFAGYFLGHIPENHETEVDVIGGSSVLLRKEIGDEIGWWSEEYFMYGEDIDLAFKVKQAGYKIRYVPDVIIHHYHGASSGLKKNSQSVTKATQETKARSIRAGVDAMKIFYRKYYQGKYPKFATAFILNTISFLGFIRLLKNRILQ